MRFSFSVTVLCSVLASSFHYIQHSTTNYKKISKVLITIFEVLHLVSGEQTPLKIDNVYSSGNIVAKMCFNLMIIITWYPTLVILPAYPAEKRAAAAARKRFILDPFSDHLIFVQVFRVSLFSNLIVKNCF